jgi:hypothetical protein
MGCLHIYIHLFGKFDSGADAAAHREVSLTMDRLNRLLGQGGFGGFGGHGGMEMGDSPQVDNAEIIYISPLSLLKVLQLRTLLTEDAQTRPCGSAA